MIKNTNINTNIFSSTIVPENSSLSTDKSFDKFIVNSNINSNRNTNIESISSLPNPILLDRSNTMNLSIDKELFSGVQTKENIYYGKNKKSIMEQQKIHQKNVPFNDMLKEMKKRIDNEKRRLQIYEALGFSKTSSNNIIEGENLHMETKEISNENLNRTLSNNQNKADKYIELLQMDLDEYFNRYQQSIFRRIIGIITKKDIRNKIKSARQEINKIIYNTLNNKKNGIIEYSKLKKDIIQKLNDLKMPKIYFDLFRTRKGIRNLRNQHIDINYTIMNTNNNELIKQKLERGYNFNTEKFIITRDNRGIDKLISALGINKIIRYGDTINKHMFRQSIVDKEITKSILEYMIDIRLPIKSIEDPIFTRKNEYLKTYISYQILKSFNSTDVFLNNVNKNANLLGHGGVGKVYIKENLIYKYEDIRFKTPNKKFTTGHSLLKRSVYYKFNNYNVYTILIQLIIQNYLYYINNKYVPEFISYAISYDKNLSLTIMKKAFENNIKLNNNERIFQDSVKKFIENESLYDTFTINMFIILKELCVILDIYQKKCYFVHGDLHANNIILDCKINKKNLIYDIKIKLIDFAYSSIILNINGDLKMLKDIGFGTFKLFEKHNPYISNIWNKSDILYFILCIIYDLKNSGYFEFNNKNSHNKYLNNFLLSLFNIFHINKDIYIIFLKKIVLSEINGSKKNIDTFILFVNLFISEKSFNNYINNNKKKDFLNSLIPNNLKNIINKHFFSENI